MNEGLDMDLAKNSFAPSSLFNSQDDVVISGNLTVNKNPVNLESSVWGVTRWADDWTGTSGELVEVCHWLIENGYTPYQYCPPGYWSPVQWGRHWHQLHFDSADQKVMLSYRVKGTAEEEKVITSEINYYGVEDLIKSINTLKSQSAITSEPS
jgi:hypothetical protein